MARNHGRIFTSIWNDPDFLDVSAGAQRLYLLLLSQQNLSHAGVLPLTVTRWARLAKNTTRDQVGRWLEELEERRFVVADQDTEELLIRSLIRGDEVWRQPNVMIAAGRDALAIASVHLQVVMAGEVARILEIDGLPAGSRKVLEGLRDGLPDPSASPSPNPSANPSGDPSPGNPSGNPSPNPSSNPQGKGKGTLVTTGGSPSPSPSPSTSEAAPRRADVERLCRTLAERMTANGCTPPVITSRWRESARLLLDRDGRPLDEALALIGWAQDSDFWRANVQSLPKFRERYDQLRLQRDRESPRPPERGIHGYELDASMT